MNTAQFPAKTADLRFRIRVMLGLFVVSLIVSGISAFPVQRELSLMLAHPEFFSKGYNSWFNTIYRGVTETYSKYPWMAYGTDWLGFAHISLSVFFIGAFIDPVRNKWIIVAGMIMSLMIFPHSFISGHFEGIPVGWRMLDWSFGFFSFLLLGFCYRNIEKLERIEASLK